MKSAGNTLPKFTMDWLGGIILLAGGFLPIMGLSVLNVFTMLLFKKNFQYDAFFALLSNSLLWLGAIAAFDFFICRPQTGKKLNFNFSTKNISTYLFIFPLMLGMMFVAEFVTSQIPITGPFWGNLYEKFSEALSQITEDKYVMVVMLVAFAPLFEEIVFRGIVMKGLINKGLKPTYAIWISAIIFGAIHGYPWQFVGGVLLGYVLGLVYYRTKSLLMPILLHAFNNGISCIMMIYSNTENFSDFLGVSEYLLLGIGIIIFALFYYLFTRKYKIYHAD